MTAKATRPRAPGAGKAASSIIGGPAGAAQATTVKILVKAGRTVLRKRNFASSHALPSRRPRNGRHKGVALIEAICVPPRKNL